AWPPPGRRSPARRGEVAVGLLRGRVQGRLRGGLAEQRRDHLTAERRGYPRVLRDLRPRLEHVMQVLREQPGARVLLVEVGEARQLLHRQPGRQVAGGQRVLQQVGRLDEELQELQRGGDPRRAVVEDDPVVRTG